MDIDEVINEIYRHRRNLFRKEKQMKKRLMSPVIWTQLVLLIAEALKLFGVYEIPNDVLNSIQDFITLGFQIFSGLNDPTTREHF